MAAAPGLGPGVRKDVSVRVRVGALYKRYIMNKKIVLNIIGFIVSVIGIVVMFHFNPWSGTQSLMAWGFILASFYFLTTTLHIVDTIDKND